MNVLSMCDMIYVLNKGVLVEKGKHEELISDSNSFYHKLFVKKEINN
jgi:ABC-type multidrug transport system fused ATPase/permease subunit